MRRLKTIALLLAATIYCWLALPASLQAQLRPGYFTILTVLRSLTVGGALNLAATSTPGVTVQNTTASTGAVPVQMSPSSGWLGHVWNTSADETSLWFAENLPATAATPTSLWRLGYSRNGGAATYPLQVSNVGTLFPLAGMQIPSGNPLCWVAQTCLLTSTDGKIGLYNNALSGFTALQFGGTTSSFPSLKRSGTDLQARLADDTGYSAIDVASLKISGSAVTFPTICANTSQSSDITGTATETAFDLNCAVPANALVAGSTITMDLRGIYSGNATDTLIFKLKACTVSGCASGTVVTLSTTTAVTLASVTNQYWDIQGQVIAWTIGASGTYEVQAKGLVASTGIAATVLTAPNTAALTVDTTVIEYLTLTAKFSTTSGSNHIRIRNMRIAQQ